jgi:hypothetical protein
MAAARNMYLVISVMARTNKLRLWNLEIDHKRTEKICTKYYCCVLIITNMETVRYTDVLCDKFNVIGIYASTDCEHKLIIICIMAVLRK